MSKSGTNYMKELQKTVDKRKIKTDNVGDVLWIIN